jgi:glycosyltransferase involved in cell wall biosynthesis
MAHGHPSIHKGGGEVAAYSMFKMLRENGHKSVFVGWSGFAESPNKGVLQEVGDDDYMLYTQSEYFHFSSTSPNLKKALEALIEKYKPEVIHLHHYIHVGIEVASLVKQMSPNTKVVMTLHEFLAICANNGQLFTKEGKVCEGYLPERCHKCFPERSVQEFFMRELAIKSAFSFVDHFISPSEFLMNQYIDWGIPKEKISAIENPLSFELNDSFVEIAPPANGENWKIGFFGQINFYKGLDVIIDGLKIAIDQGANVEIGIHGKFSAVTGQDYIDDLQKNIELLGDNAKFFGPYDQADVLSLMSSYHFIVMGSRWYENSPVVILEAIAAGRPMIMPSHGGMLEKAFLFGIKYKPSSFIDFANLILKLKNNQFIDKLKFVLELRGNLSSIAMVSFEKTIQVYVSNTEK